MLSLNLEFEKAIRFITTCLPPSEATTRKPILPHCLRVGVYLYEHDYSREIVLAGLLHDVVEFSKTGKQELQEQFGEAVVKLVLACTKDDTIESPEEKTTELIKRCVAAGQDALIVKAADIMDSFKYYTRVNNQKELEYCERNARAIFAYMPDSFTDPIFADLKKKSYV